MILNNFKKIIMQSAFSATSSAAQSSSFPTIDTIIDIDGNTQSGIGFNYYFANALNHMYNYDTAGCTTIHIGTGNTAPTSDDYTLEDEVTTGFSRDNGITSASGNYNKTYTQTFTNTSNEDITVSEVGLMYTGYNITVMLDRTVLSPSIIIPAGESKAITIELAM